MYLKEVWYVPGLTLNLISVARLAADGAQITISKNQLQLKKAASATPPPSRGTVCS